ncbi:glycosyltransferase family 2 protein [Pseudalkalibacillus caeni]|uniref:Galactosyltransferase C-terminal domain-containing protein n=1 Tax=Exobacillus caeni TaxID=2574798 RepID=A0A5R9F4Z9_9BACL|nr:glycosyltransferase family 2 protein [Pseudalkalibacillus caeni]TLS37470.1 hypothetical protein FCL54_10005 [Pseudalkalibacillus caeni]
MERLSILIPYKSDKGPREKVFKWVCKFYERNLSQADIYIGESSTKIFSRAQSINHAAQAASGNVFVITDGDIVCRPETIMEAVKQLHHSPMVIPYSNILDLTKESTYQTINGSAEWPGISKPRFKVRFKGKAYTLGGINIVKRDCFEAVKGFDERFIGWGGEDDAFAFSIKAVCGKYQRLNNVVYHMWHPRENYQHTDNFDLNKQLAMRYLHAANSKERMIEIINERD